MELPIELVRQFVDATNDSNTSTPVSKVCYGVAVVKDNGIYVKIDGSGDILTPVSMATDAKNGDRVMVTIDNHRANISANLTSPSSGRTATDLYNVKKNQDGTIVITGELRAAKEYVDELVASDITADSIIAQTMKVKELEATKAYIDKLEANDITADSIISQSIDVENLKATKAYIDELEANNITADSIIANDAIVKDLKTNKADIDILSAVNAYIQNLDVDKEIVKELIANRISADKLDAVMAEIDNLKSNSASIETLNSYLINTKIISADNANFGYLQVSKADIDFANVIALEASDVIIQNLLTAGKIMTDDIHAVTGQFTKYLTGVNISGDLINAGTISTERLIIKNKDSNDGILFAINDIGELDQTSLTSDELKRLTLDGKLITAGTITADKISVTDLNAFGATIGGFQINKTQIKSNNNDIVLNSNGSFILGGMSYNSETGNFSLDPNTYLSGGGDGNKRTLGESLSFTEVKYGLSSSETECDVEEWDDILPERTSGTYIWQRTIYHYANGTTKNTDVCIQGSKGDSGEDATLLRIESSRGTTFKNNNISTVLSAVIWKGPKRITDIHSLREEYGITAYIEWSWQKLNATEFGIISASDSRIGNDGFTLTISPNDVDEKVNFLCELKV